MKEYSRMKYGLFLILLTIMSLLLFTSNTEARQLNEIDKLIKKYGKSRIQHAILDKQNSITIQVDNELRTFFGAADTRYINKYTISHDLHRMGMSVKQLEQLVKAEEAERNISVSRPIDTPKEKTWSFFSWLCDKSERKTWREWEEGKEGRFFTWPWNKMTRQEWQARKKTNKEIRKIFEQHLPLRVKGDDLKRRFAPSPIDDLEDKIEDLESRIEELENE